MIEPLINELKFGRQLYNSETLPNYHELMQHFIQCSEQQTCIDTSSVISKITDKKIAFFISGKVLPIMIFGIDANFFYKLTFW